MKSVGVLAVQGDFDRHAASLVLAGAERDQIRFVRGPADLSAVDRLIIPGGESTTVGLLLERFGLGSAIRERAVAGMPIWGTCMGMILMAAKVEDRDQYSLNLLDITIRRNAFGAQVHSFEDRVTVEGLDEPVLGVFIRAPIVSRLGAGVEPIAQYEGAVVGVRQGKLLGTSFHPELTDDYRLHGLFLSF